MAWYMALVVPIRGIVLCIGASYKHGVYWRVRSLSARRSRPAHKSCVLFFALSLNAQSETQLINKHKHYYPSMPFDAQFTASALPVPVAEGAHVCAGPRASTSNQINNI